MTTTCALCSITTLQMYQAVCLVKLVTPVQLGSPLVPLLLLMFALRTPTLGVLNVSQGSAVVAYFSEQNNLNEKIAGDGQIMLHLPYDRGQQLLTYSATGQTPGSTPPSLVPTLEWKELLANYSSARDCLTSTLL